MTHTLQVCKGTGRSILVPQLAKVTNVAKDIEIRVHRILNLFVCEHPLAEKEKPRRYHEPLGALKLTLYFFPLSVLSSFWIFPLCHLSVVIRERCQGLARS